jgi:cytochrome b561
MNWRNTSETFGAGSKALHWVVALLVIGLIGVGLYMTRLDPSPVMFQTYALHKSVGIVVLAIMVLRVLWCVSNPRPRALDTHKAWERHLAHGVHFALYVSLFVMPLSGWLMSSAKGFSVSVFGLFTLPDFIRPDEAMAQMMVTVHEVTAYMLIVLIGLHMAGAVKHHVIDRDGTLLRMVPSALHGILNRKDR